MRSLELMAHKRTAKAMRVLGVMTGTSCDGLDAACMRFGARSVQVDWVGRAKFPLELRSRVLRLQRPKERVTLLEYLELDRDLGQWYGKALKKMIQNHKTALPDIIANHGQTVAHHPFRRRGGVTLQMGNAFEIAEATGLTVVHDMRRGDIASGGQGAPLVPSFHEFLVSTLPTEIRRSGVAIHNIGGISNLTYVDPDGKIIAFDTGPGNLLIDAAVKRMTHGKKIYDRGGRIAASGRAHSAYLKKLLSHPFLRRMPPKSTGRDDFSAELMVGKAPVRGANLVMTMTAFTAESIARAYERFIDPYFPLSFIFLSGGGAKNRFLLECLRQRLPEVAVGTVEELGIDSQSVECLAFAFLGWKTLQGLSLGGAWTGAHPDGVPGTVIPGANWAQVLAKLD